MSRAPHRPDTEITPRVTANPAADGILTPLPALTPRAGVGLITFGGWGQAVGRGLLTAEAALGRTLAVRGIDNATIDDRPLVLLDGRQLPAPVERWRHLTDDTPRRTRIRAHPALRQFFEDSGLL